MVYCALAVKGQLAVHHRAVKGQLAVHRRDAYAFTNLTGPRPRVMGTTDRAYYTMILVFSMGASSGGVTLIAVSSHFSMFTEGCFCDTHVKAVSASVGIFSSVDT